MKIFFNLECASILKKARKLHVALITLIIIKSQRIETSFVVGFPDSIAEKKLTEFEEKTHDEDSTRQSPSHTPSQTPSQTSESSLSQPQQPSQQEPQQVPVIYVSEDAMDCNYDDASNLSRNLELQEAPSPELFDSENDEADDEAESTASTFPKLEEVRPSQPSLKKFTPAELTLRADKLLLRRINKYLSGVPPPPSHTISQKDCDDFLVYIKQNRQFFWADPFKLDEKTGEPEAPESKTSLVSDIASDSHQVRFLCFLGCEIRFCPFKY